jgi:hypothetical protein
MLGIPLRYAYFFCTQSLNWVSSVCLQKVQWFPLYLCYNLLNTLRDFIDHAIFGTPHKKNETLWQTQNI